MWEFTLIFQPLFCTFLSSNSSKQTKMRCDAMWIVIIGFGLHCNFRYSLIHTFSILVPHQLFPLSHFLWFCLPMIWWYVKWHPFFHFVGHSSKHSRGYRGKKRGGKIRHTDENGYFFPRALHFQNCGKKILLFCCLDIKQKMLHNV